MFKTSLHFLPSSHPRGSSVRLLCTQLIRRRRLKPPWTTHTASASPSHLEAWRIWLATLKQRDYQKKRHHCLQRGSTTSNGPIRLRALLVTVLLHHTSLICLFQKDCQGSSNTPRRSVTSRAGAQRPESSPSILRLCLQTAARFHLHCIIILARYTTLVGLCQNQPRLGLSNAKD
ncbi:hypothetical protein BU25DRAFT_57456 [Macroventuria anomochaeta]|uniref:Uncharacterized protein n=1 Tax=Macroventuria anomochaeta TaxID=301207 RepID=A0ACB6S132_9PLEO|nr:uncharacterized protein BU25DRAFT_57456 [Macroventuria anomochaeta]KAF2627658.1 hypothetical protein BU25DRAFT_57456 [Macroventuria anomochaeta]